MDYGESPAARSPLSMNFFLGTFIHKVDGKGRVFIPRPILDSVERPEERTHFVLTLGLDSCLYLFTQGGFAAHLKPLPPSAFGDEKSRTTSLGLGASSRRVPVDAQGRILLPDDLRGKAGIGDEAAVVGALDHVQIWDSKVWAEGRASEVEEAFRTQASDVLGGDSRLEGGGR